MKRKWAERLTVAGYILAWLFYAVTYVAGWLMLGLVIAFLLIWAL